MPSDSGHQNGRLTKALNTAAPPPPLEQEQLPCPRCDSTNTKFCYYNNYNFSQPRHFCKSCRRYWTHGGTLRDIPVGGGTRKNTKRSRTTASTPGTVISSTNAATTTTTTTSYNDFPLPATQVLLPLSTNQGTFDVVGGVSKGNNGGGTGTICGSFSSLLNTHQGRGLLLGGFGLGTAPALEDVGFGLGREMWPFSGLGGGAAVGSGADDGATRVVENTWHFEGGEPGSVGAGDCFSWPDLAISTPGNGLK